MYVKGVITCVCMYVSVFVRMCVGVCVGVCVRARAEVSVYVDRN